MGHPSSLNHEQSTALEMWQAFANLFWMFLSQLSTKLNKHHFQALFCKASNRLLDIYCSKSTEMRCAFKTLNSKPGRKGSPWRQSGGIDSGRGRQCFRLWFWGCALVVLLPSRAPTFAVDKRVWRGSGELYANPQLQVLANICPWASYIPSLGLSFLYCVLGVDKMAHTILWSL